MNTSFIKQGWREKFERRVHFPDNPCVSRSWHPTMATNWDAQGPALHRRGNKLKKYPWIDSLSLKKLPACSPVILNMGIGLKVQWKRFSLSCLVWGSWISDVHEKRKLSSMTTQSKRQNPPKMLKCETSTCRYSSYEVSSER